MIKRLLGGLCLIFSFLLAKSQTTLVSGTVTDAKDGSVIPGVSVLAQGVPGIGTQTDSKGAYQLSVPPSAKQLSFKYVGYRESAVSISGKTLNIQLQPDAKQLNELLVVGYGTQKRADVTGAIASVTGKEVENTPVTTFEQAIQGKAAGVFVQANNGKLGQGIKISVRGTASISAGTQPLVVVDGIIINNENLSSTTAATDPLAEINFNDVASFEILKDASASAIYGARASNGVILITTKKGRSGKASINFTAQFGNSEPSRHRNFLNSQQFLQIEERAGVGAGKQDFAAGLYPSLAAAETYYKKRIESRFTNLAAGNTNWAATNTDWEKQAFQTAPQQEYDLNISSGNEKTTYYIGGQALNEQGILKSNSFARYSGRLNLTTKVFNNLDVGMNLNFIHTLNKRISNDDAFSTNLQIVALSPVTPLIDPQSGLVSGTPPGAFSNYPLYYNPLISVNNAYYHTNVYRTLGNVFANWEFLKGLAFRTEFGVDQTNQSEDQYLNSLTVRNTGTPNGLGENSTTGIIHYTFNNYLTYKTILNTRHSLDFTLGTSYEFNNRLDNDVQGKNFPSDAYRTIQSAAVISSGFSRQSEYSFVSYFARASYAFQSKYLISVSGRDEASSRFGANNRYGFFWAGSVGWMITEENFLKNSNTLSNLKLRGSYGITGNADIQIPGTVGIANYAALGLFSGDANYNNAAGQRFFQIANPNLKWEKTAQIDLGVDFGLFGNRLSGAFDYYRKNTRDLLLNVNIPQTLGLSTQTQNLGRLYNQGYELELTDNLFVGKFKWTSVFNAAYNKNVVTDVNGLILGNDDLNRVITGQPIGVFYGREYAGVDPANGDALYRLNTKNPNNTLNRGTTKDYNAAQNVVLGNPTPKYTGGFTNNFALFGFDLSVTFQGAFGNKIYNGGGQYMSSAAGNGYDNQTLDQMNYWDKPGDKTNVPEPRLFYGNGTNPSSRYIYDGSYIRLKTLSLGYTIPKALLAKVHIEHLRVFVNGYNLFLITKYKGWDPEVNSDFQASDPRAANINLGVDFYSAPQPRTITFGLNVGL